MNGSSKYSGLSAAEKGKRKAPSDGHNPTPGPSSQPGMIAPSRRVGRLIAAKPSTIFADPKSAPIVGSEPPQLHKRTCFDHDSQPASELLPGPEVAPTSEQSMNLTNYDTLSQSAFRHTDTTLGCSITQAFENDYDCQTLGTFNPSPDLPKTTHAEAAYSSLPPLFQTTTMNSGDFQIPITQASVGCCPRCRALLRNLRESILTITCGDGEGLPSSGGAMRDLWKSYFSLEGHWSEGHVFGGTWLPAGVEV
ncbi:hypothetical protein BGX38DRAFT_1299151 [Terfezia claveryi]|nr:hypothetical protein BGX38DRAFT_1299151 [Terfezia claveryi]